MSSRRTSASLILLVVAAVAPVLGCASATLDVVSPVPVPPRVVALAISDHTYGDMDGEQLRGLKRTVTRELLDAGIDVVPSTSKPGAVRVVGSILRYDPGIRALRFVTRYGLGTGVLESEWDVVDGRSSTLARCRIEGSVSMGTFGGSFEDVEVETGKALARCLKGDLQ